jgi:hypothetical protein
MTTSLNVILMIAERLEGECKLLSRFNEPAVPIYGRRDHLLVQREGLTAS